MAKREENREQRRKDIMRVSLDMFVRRGYHGTTTRDIAEACGISTGLMFHYFASKEQLYLELLKTASVGVNMAGGIAPDASPIETFTRMAEFIVGSFHDGFTVKMFLLIKQALAGDFLTGEMRRVIDHDMDLMHAVIPLIEEGQRRGEIRRGDALTLSVCFFSCIQGVAENAACYPELPLPGGEMIVSVLRA